jgi:prophage tail gpP-like protein
MHYFPPPTLFYDNESNVRLVTGGAGTVSQKAIDDAKEKAKTLAAQATKDTPKINAAAGPKAPASIQGSGPFNMFQDAATRAAKEAAQLEAAAGSAASRSKKTIEYVQPHPNEGAFEFIARNLRRFGLWIWATADGSLVISKPNYDQEPRYILQRVRGDRIVSVEHASYVYDRTNIPSQITVRGKSSGKDFEKATVKGYIRDTNARDTEFFEPFYLQHDQATTPEGAGAFAAQEMSHLKQDERVYTCICPGHRDPRTKNIYAIDSIAVVEDDVCGVHEQMWIASRTFKRSASGGTTTELKLLPKGAIIFSDADATDMARTKKRKK